MDIAIVKNLAERLSLGLLGLASLATTACTDITNNYYGTAQTEDSAPSSDTRSKLFGSWQRVEEDGMPYTPLQPKPGKGALLFYQCENGTPLYFPIGNLDTCSTAGDNGIFRVDGNYVVFHWNPTTLKTTVPVEIGQLDDQRLVLINSAPEAKTWHTANLKAGVVAEFERVQDDYSACFRQRGRIQETCDRLLPFAQETGAL